MLLTEPVDAADPLLHVHRVPRHVLVHEPPTIAEEGAGEWRRSYKRPRKVVLMS